MRAPRHLTLVEPYSPRIPDESIAHFTITIRRRHLRLLPPAAGTLAAALTIGVLSGLDAVLTTVCAYVGTALAMAAVDLFVEWRRERRLDRAIERSIPLYDFSHHPSRFNGGEPA